MFCSLKINNSRTQKVFNVFDYFIYNDCMKYHTMEQTCSKKIIISLRLISDEREPRYDLLLLNVSYKAHFAWLQSFAVVLAKDLFYKNTFQIL